MSNERAWRILMTADAAGGVWSYAITLVEALGPRAEVLLAVTGPKPSAAQRAAAATIPGLRVIDGDFCLEWMPDAGRDLDRASLWLRELAAEFKPDIIHVNGYAAAAARWAVPVVVVGHSCVLSWWQAVHGTSPPPEWSAYARRVARGLAAADQVVAPTSAMLRALSCHYGLPRSGRVIANGCALERFSATAKEKIALAAGRFWDKGKNLAALDAAAALTAWPVFLAGDCRDPSGHPMVPRSARMLGVLPSETLAERMGRAAIYAFPARYEPFGLSVLEAAASGCALVLGDIASLRELWHGTALFVSPDDSPALADAIDRLMADDERRTALAAAARARAQRFSASAMARSYADLYGRLTGRPPLATARSVEAV